MSKKPQSKMKSKAPTIKSKVSKRINPYTGKTINKSKTVDRHLNQLIDYCMKCSSDRILDYDTKKCISRDSVKGRRDKEVTLANFCDDYSNSIISPLDVQFVKNVLKIELPQLFDGKKFKIGDFIEKDFKLKLGIENHLTKRNFFILLTGFIVGTTVLVALMPENIGKFIAAAVSALASEGVGNKLISNTVKNIIGTESKHASDIANAVNYEAVIEKIQENAKPAIDIIKKNIIGTKHEDDIMRHRITGSYTKLTKESIFNNRSIDTPSIHDIPCNLGNLNNRIIADMKTHGILKTKINAEFIDVKKAKIASKFIEKNPRGVKLDELHGNVFIILNYNIGIDIQDNRNIIPGMGGYGGRNGVYGNMDLLFGKQNINTDTSFYKKLRVRIYPNDKDTINDTKTEMLITISNLCMRISKLETRHNELLSDLKNMDKYDQFRRQLVKLNEYDKNKKAANSKDKDKKNSEEFDEEIGNFLTQIKKYKIYDTDENRKINPQLLALEKDKFIEIEKIFKKMNSIAQNSNNDAFNVSVACVNYLIVELEKKLENLKEM